jgi:hypothetical protein
MKWIAIPLDQDTDIETKMLHSGQCRIFDDLKLVSRLNFFLDISVNIESFHDTIYYTSIIMNSFQEFIQYIKQNKIMNECSFYIYTNDCIKQIIEKDLEKSNIFYKFIESYDEIKKIDLDYFYVITNFQRGFFEPNSKSKIKIFKKLNFKGD